VNAVGISSVNLDLCWHPLLFDEHLAAQRVAAGQARVGGGESADADAEGCHA